MKNNPFANRFKEQPKPVEVKPEVHNILLDRVFIALCVFLLLLAIWVGVKPLFV